MTKVNERVVAVTGAASGIGRALAVRLAAKGASLALSDINEAGLRETAELLRDAKGKVTTHVVDVRSRDAVYTYATEAEYQHGCVDVIINNAGLSVWSTIEDISYEDFELVLNVNLWGVIYGTKAFLPLLRRRPEGHIVNISSINAMVPFAKNGPYNISKYAVLGLCETLVQELQGEPIHVTCVHPGGIQTNIARAAKGVTEAEAAYFGRIAMTSPDKAAKTIIAGIEGNKERVYVGFDAKAMATAKRLLPALTVNLVGRLSRRPIGQ